MASYEDILSQYPTKEALLAGLEGDDAVDIEMAIDELFRERVRTSYEFVNGNRLEDGFGPGDIGWDPLEEAADAIQTHFLKALEEHVDGNTPRSRAIWEMVGDRAYDYGMELLKELDSSDIRYGSDRSGTYAYDGVRIGTLMEQFDFYVGNRDLGFDLSKRADIDAYTELVSRVALDPFWTYDEAQELWISGMDVVEDRRDNGIYVLVPDYDTAVEMMLDWRFERLVETIEEDPGLAIDYMFQELERIDPEAYRALRKAKLPLSVLVSYASAFIEMSQQDYDDEERVAFIREAMGIWGYEGSQAETILEIDADILEELGVTGGKWLDNAPWRLVNLPPNELAYEGTLLRHCVGRFDMHYRESVEDGDIWIWSLRDAKNRPRLTWEVALVDGGLPWEDEEDIELFMVQNAVSRDQVERWRRRERGRMITQLKGFANRLAGAGADEQIVLEYIFEELAIDPASVSDYSPRNRNPVDPWV